MSKRSGREKCAAHLWTDSSVTLAWIKGQPERWKDFVGNRVALIHELVPDSQWRHIAGTENPADVASRGSTPDQLQQHPLWWRGPRWLAEPSLSWPISSPHLPDDVNLEERPSVVTSVLAEPPTWSVLERHSSLTRLLRVTAYVRRAAARFQRSNNRSNLVSPLAPEEIGESLTFWIQKVQQAHFGNDIATLQSGEALPSSSHLLRLTPFVDGKGVLRVGGWLQNSDLDYDAKHPAVLPRRCHLSFLVIADTHRRTLHSGVQLTLSTIRQRFWILGGRSPVHSVIVAVCHAHGNAEKPQNK